MNDISIKPIQPFSNKIGSKCWDVGISTSDILENIKVSIVIQYGSFGYLKIQMEEMFGDFDYYSLTSDSPLTSLLKKTI